MRRIAKALALAAFSSATLFAAVATTPVYADTVLQSAELSRVVKSTSGTASIIETSEGRFLEFSDDFNTGSGPDVLVLLHKSASPSTYDEEEYVNLGLMSDFSGAQRFAIPDDVDLAEYESVVLWCRRFNVTFGAGALR